MGNRYSSYANTPDGFGTRGVAVTADPSNDLPGNPKAVICLTAGNITLIPAGNADNETITFTGVPAFFIPPFRPRRVTSTTCTVYTIE